MRKAAVMLAACALQAVVSPSFAEVDMLPKEPLAIGVEPQFFIDDYLVDNRWSLRQKHGAVVRVFHEPQKHEKNPVIAGDGGYVSVVRDDEAGLYRMWYQTHHYIKKTKPVEVRYGVAYAESPDGLVWTRPDLDLVDWPGAKPNNVVLSSGRRGSQGGFLLELPEKDRGGHRFVLLYRDSEGIHLIGSQDGIHWAPDSDTIISHIHSDTSNVIVHDPIRDKYVMFCRAKHIYRRRKGHILDVGASRRVARMESAELRTQWPDKPQTILVPDNLDSGKKLNFFYGMPTRYYAGLYWGFLWPFKMNTDIDTELAFSRDGVRFQRLPGRPKLIRLGPEGSWDDGMVFGGCRWVEVGDEWWIYYSGFDGPHNSRDRTPGIGLARVRREGLVSLHAPASGGVVCTRRLLWPGGGLLANVDAGGGEFRVRVSDAQRQPIPGFDYTDCAPFSGDGVAHEVTWGKLGAGELAGKVIRLEFLLKNAHLYTFRAAGDGPVAAPSAAAPAPGPLTPALPREPVRIGEAPQFVFDRYIIDNHWGLKYKKEAVLTRFHQPVKCERNPLIGDGGYVSVVHDREAGLFRMWYQAFRWIRKEKPIELAYAIAYAESKDGVEWDLPGLGLHEWMGGKDNNIVMRGKGRWASSPFITQVAAEDRRGYRFVMLYKDAPGIRLVGSKDGIHWDEEGDTLVTRLHSDTQNALLCDPARQEYVMYCRAKHLYGDHGAQLDSGAPRRVARMSGPGPWTEWRGEPQNILIPDELDCERGFGYFYGMPTVRRHGIYWGFLWPFKMNTVIYTELVTSRDGVRFDRLPERPRLLELGPEGSWDCGMILASPPWVEVGDEWWLYYGGHNGPHESRERRAGIGLARIRKEGFISMRGPRGGGVLVTRELVWPGGQLLVNAAAEGGELKVRVTAGRRDTAPGFGFDDCVPFTGDSVAHVVRWQDRSVAEFAGKPIRLEFFLRDADLYTFRASAVTTAPGSAGSAKPGAAPDGAEQKDAQ